MTNGVGNAPVGQNYSPRPQDGASQDILQKCIATPPSDADLEESWTVITNLIQSAKECPSQAPWHLEAASARLLQLLDGVVAAKHAVDDERNQMRVDAAVKQLPRIVMLGDASDREVHLPQAQLKLRSAFDEGETFVDAYLQAMQVYMDGSGLGVDNEAVLVEVQAGRLDVQMAASLQSAFGEQN